MSNVEQCNVVCCDSCVCKEKILFYFLKLDWPKTFSVHSLYLYAYLTFFAINVIAFDEF